MIDFLICLNYVGSFAAIFDSNELFKEFTRRLKLSEVDENSPGMIHIHIISFITSKGCILTK